MDDRALSYSEHLFSYGTLQYESVQLAIFWRVLQGIPDLLRNYKLSKTKISNPDIVVTSGEAEHPIIIFTGNSADEVSGVVFDISSDELTLCDEYEAADYRSISVELCSGTAAWVYVLR